MRTITGVAAERRPRVASTLPWPIQVTLRGPLCAVDTMSPGRSFSTCTSPSGVSINVPTQKHMVVSSVPLMPPPEEMVTLPADDPKCSTSWVPPLFVSVTDVPPPTAPVLTAVNPVTSIVSP